MAAPSDKDTTLEDGSLERITEGRASILFTKNEAFYNPVQQFNRDLSTVMLSLFAKRRQRETEERGIFDPSFFLFPLSDELTRFPVPKQQRRRVRRYLSKASPFLRHLPQPGSAASDTHSRRKA